MTQTEPQTPQSQQHHAWAQVPPDAGGERPSRKLATIALVFAVVMVLAGVVQGIVIAVMGRTGAFELMGAVGLVASVAGGLLALGAAGFGIASLARRESARALAGAAIGAAAVNLVGLVAVLAQTTLHAVL
ncbi:hypothetical protein [Agrococcus sp. Ld7]|uniref:hypothetical protein n=1 Tax=Agrococcus sp. Ld7 TaxID=649148 RepID=UPI0038669BAA